MIKSIQDAGVNVTGFSGPGVPLLLPAACSADTNYEPLKDLLSLGNAAVVDGGSVQLGWITLSVVWGWVDEGGSGAVDEVADSLRSEFDIRGQCVTQRTMVQDCSFSTISFKDLSTAGQSQFQHVSDLSACTEFDRIESNGELTTRSEKFDSFTGQVAHDVIEVRHLKSSTAGESTGGSLLVIGHYQPSGAAYFVSIDIIAAEADNYDGGYTADDIAELLTRVSQGALDDVQGTLAIRLSES